MGRADTTTVGGGAEALNHAVLDNVVWHAINGAQAPLAEHNGRAGRFDREVAPFAGRADGSAESWDDLARLVGPGKPAILFAPDLHEPQGWVRDHTIPCLQMVATNVSGTATSDDMIELTAADVPEMLELVAATRPGPFATRTIELGRYVGIRRDGRLVAMTGERLKPDRFTEVSAVCTADEVRGQGLGRLLVLAVVAGIRARGDEAFLHVATDNTPAIALYESLGFTTRLEAEAVIMRRQ
jgi:ribosomal protein S18 acetylase RimI-like enzyme